MRDLIGKVIQVNGSELNRVPSDTGQSAVVVFNQTRRFTVEKQKNATFNISNPRKVIFLGGGGDEDQTTRAEKREEDLENRRKSKVGAFFTGAGKKEKESDESDESGSRSTFGKLFSGIGKALAPFLSLGGQLLTTIGAVLSLEFLRNPMKFLRRIPGLGGTAARAGGAVVRAGASIFRGIKNVGKGVFDFLTKPRTFGKPPTSPKTPRPPQPRGPDGRFVKATDAAGDASKASKAAKTGKVAKFLTSGSKLARFARLGLGTSTFGLSLLADYLIFESARQADELVDLMKKNNDALNNLPGQDKMKFQREYEGRTVKDYHMEMSELFRTIFPDMLDEINASKVERREPIISELDFIESQIGDYFKYALPHKNSGLKINEGTLLAFAQAHEKAAGGADAQMIISSKELEDTLRNERSKRTGGARLQGGFFTKVAGFLGLLPGDTTIEPSNVDTRVPTGRNAFAEPREQRESLPIGEATFDATEVPRFREMNEIPMQESNPVIIFNEGDRGRLEAAGAAAMSTRDHNADELRNAAMGTNHGDRTSGRFIPID
tara:strand:+ start:341 stop:1990 length:1650 start_codon:yes stop_codon:yes gene_type:complete